MPNEWQVIFNAQTGQWGIERSGDTTRKPENDVLVVTVTPRQSSAMQESLAYKINNNEIVLAWENLEILVSVK